jgi:hypothetical protein
VPWRYAASLVSQLAVDAEPTWALAQLSLSHALAKAWHCRSHARTQSHVHMHMCCVQRPQMHSRSQASCTRARMELASARLQPCSKASCQMCTGWRPYCEQQSSARSRQVTRSIATWRGLLPRGSSAAPLIRAVAPLIRAVSPQTPLAPLCVRACARPGAGGDGLESCVSAFMWRVPGPCPASAACHASCSSGHDRPIADRAELRNSMICLAFARRRLALAQRDIVRIEQIARAAEDRARCALCGVGEATS